MNDVLSHMYESAHTYMKMLSLNAQRADDLEARILQTHPGCLSVSQFSLKSLSKDRICRRTLRYSAEAKAVLAF